MVIRAYASCLHCDIAIFLWSDVWTIYGVYELSAGWGIVFYQFFHAEFVGFQWFEYFFTTGDFYRVMRNTLATSLLTLFFGFPAPIILALVLNEARQGFFKRFVQTVSYLPHFISWVIAANIVITLLASDGMLNNILVLLGIVKEPVAFLQNGPLFWWIIALSNMWKEMGFSAIMYLAAIASINPELYEAARVDGASRFKQMWHITLPSMRPTIVILAILAVGGILNAGFEQQYLLQNNTVLEYSEVIDIYAYKYGLQNSMFSYGAAVGMFKSVVAFILVLIVNRISRKVNDQALF